jgi:hypothetical protein
MILAAALLLAFTSQACAYSYGPSWGVGVTIGSAPPPPPPPPVYGGYSAGYAQGYAQGYSRGAAGYYVPPPVHVYKNKHWHKRMHKHWRGDWDD